jgi:4,5-dihydroxyphthalate decarboxylase
MLVVKESLSQSHPGAVKEIFRALRASKPAKPEPSGFDAIQFGVENIRRSLELIIKYSAQQKLIPRRFEVDELFDEMTRGLN